jgi:hypothetical protein
MRPPLWEAAGIKGDHAIGFPQLIDHLSNQDLDQRAMIPGCGADELLDDQTLDINQGGDLLGILAIQMRQETCQVEEDIALAGLGRESMLIGHGETAQPVNYVLEHVGETMQSRNSTACRYAHAGVIFSPPQNGMSIRDADWKRLIQQEVT